jgi:two-component system, sensor histidine kinase and response regulator
MNTGSSPRTSELLPANEIGVRSSPVNSEYLLERIDGDIGFLAELLEIFLEDYPILLRTARDAVNTNDSVALESVAHSLRGGLGGLGAEEAARIAGQLEQMGASGKAALAGGNLSQLKQELTRVVAALQSLCHLEPVMNCEP